MLKKLNFTLTLLLLVTSCSLLGAELRLPQAQKEEQTDQTALRKNLREDERTLHPRGGFTGPYVPTFVPVFGDFVNRGVRTAERRTDIPRLIKALQDTGAQDYMHFVWSEERYPAAWEEFQTMAPAFQAADINLWLYLTSPKQGAPEPFGEDYVRWATECAQLAKQYPVIRGICIDDFSFFKVNRRTFTPAYCREMMRAAHSIAPHLSLLVVCYFIHYEGIAEHVKDGVIDGVIFPYFFPHKNHSDIDTLLPQIKTLRTWLDAQTAKGGLARTMPLVLMVYASKHSRSTDKPTPDYVKKCLQIGLQSTRTGLIDGTVTYCLPKDRPEFLRSAAAVWSEFR